MLNRKENVIITADISSYKGSNSSEDFGSGCFAVVKIDKNILSILSMIKYDALPYQK